MNRRILHLLVIALIGMAAPAKGQGDTTAVPDAMGYFNTASKQYVKKDKPAALRTLDRALKEYPGDPRLLKLAEELVKEEQQQQAQQQQQKEQEQQREEQEQKQEQAQDQQRKENEQRQQEERGKERERQGEITRKDAERILDALDRQERAVQARVRDKQQPREKRPTEKDW